MLEQLVGLEMLYSQKKLSQMVRKKCEWFNRNEKNFLNGIHNRTWK